jgi:hypothetical protein
MKEIRLIEIPLPPDDCDEMYDFDPVAEKRAMEALENCPVDSRGLSIFNAKHSNQVDIEKLEKTLLRLNAAIKSLMRLKTLKEKL